MMHSCPDGTHTRLTRTGPVGTLKGVTFTCPRCGYGRSAAKIKSDAEAIRERIVASLAR
jgi:predicted RNA-binding Zn-ribbon protein involved in translation (DUF1610 family)